GAVSGGFTAVIVGGDFKQGMFNGAWTAGFGYLFNEIQEVTAGWLADRAIDAWKGVKQAFEGAADALTNKGVGSLAGHIVVVSIGDSLALAFGLNSLANLEPMLFPSKINDIADVLTPGPPSNTTSGYLNLLIMINKNLVEDIQSRK
ncbi:MAG: hypothetical protein AAGU75_14665, partial [Bacillota bacterium]